MKKLTALVLALVCLMTSAMAFAATPAASVEKMGNEFKLTVVNGDVSTAEAFPDIAGYVVMDFDSMWITFFGQNETIVIKYEKLVDYLEDCVKAMALLQSDAYISTGINLAINVDEQFGDIPVENYGPLVDLLNQMISDRK